MLSLSTPPDGRAAAYDAADEGARAAAPPGGALRLLRDADEHGRGALPTLATPSDVREAVRYLMKKPEGVSVAEALEDAKRRAFEPRKVAAYVSWGLVERRGSRVALTDAGREFARRLAPEAEAYRDLLWTEPVYRAALEWMHRQQAELVTHSDLSAFLAGRPDLLGGAGGDGKSLEGGVVCFFHLCQAAELGTVTIGKRGQPARLRVEREELSAWVARGRKAAAAGRACLKSLGAAEGVREETGSDERGAGQSREACAGGAALRLYVSGGGGAARVVGELRRVLELLEVESRVCERAGEAAGNVPFAEEAAGLMRGCDAALLVVTREDCEGAGRGVLVEAGAAYVLYAGRVVILHEEGLELPGALGELPRFAFRRGGLDWEAGVGLLGAIKGMIRERGMA